MGKREQCVPDVAKKLRSRCQLWRLLSWIDWLLQLQFCEFGPCLAAGLQALPAAAVGRQSERADATNQLPRSGALPRYKRDSCGLIARVVSFCTFVFCIDLLCLLYRFEVMRLED